MGYRCAAGAVREQNAQGRMVEAVDTDDDVGLAYACELFVHFRSEGGGIHNPG